MTKIAMLIIYIFLVMGPVTFKFQADQTPKRDVYDAISPEHREGLKQVVKQMTELQEQRQWNKIYDIISGPYRMETRDEFVRHNQRSSRLIRFEAERTMQSPISNSDWIVVGCAFFERNGQRKAWQSSMHATLSDGKWSVSIVLITVGEHGGFAPCETRSK